MNNHHRQSPADRPNVVLICTDQWRGDCLSGQGHPDVETPYLDQLATQGAVVERAYSATPTCVPARMALMTGLSAGSHRRVGYQDGVPFDIEDTLPSAFSQAGYQTRAIGKMHYWPERNRIGFDEVELHDGYLHYSRKRHRDPACYDDYLVWLRDQTGTASDEDYIDDGVECNSMVARPWDKAERLHPTNWAVSQATRWLYRRDPTTPFFLYLSFHRPHAPYDPPQWAFDRYNGAPLRPPSVGDWSDTFNTWRNDADPTSLVAQYRPRDIARAMAGYYGNMTHIDAQISRLRQVLGEFGVADNTYIAFISDHGDMMGDHHLWRKGYPYEGSTHIPFLLAGPGITPGTKVDELVELRDVMPTLLDCAGVDIPDSVEGRSILPLLRNESSWRTHLHGEHFLLNQSLQWIWWDNYQYIWMSGSGKEQLFDLKADPRQLHDLSDDPSHAHQLDHGRRLLIAELTGREEGFVHDGSLVTGRPVGCVLEHPTPPPAEGR
ncbi:arylsulfatase [Cutibacterium sp.]|uniref:arylsulfatase n=1 Tax=Cutibacterium sp. TaxID=1912221 RepID=UPI0026DC3245|nr:arylsulfatase [Cutibacterium sp.]MDO4412586.1 arylsulfatase [Cutibacterium sp.]